MPNLNSLAKVEDLVSNEAFDFAASDLATEAVELQNDDNILSATTGYATLGKIAAMAYGLWDLLGSPSTRRGYGRFNGTPVALSGTWTWTAGNTTLNGSSGVALTELNNNEFIIGPGNVAKKVKAVVGNNQITLTTPFSIGGAGVTLSRGKTLSERLDTEFASRKSAIDYSKAIGELFTLDWPKATNYTFNPATPRTYWPAWNLSAIDVTETVDNTDIPQASLDHLRAIYLIYLPGKSGEVSQWSVTVSGSDITFPNTTSANAMLAALSEDKDVQGTFTNGRTVNINGSDWAITGINLITRVVTVSGSPTTGSQTAIFYHHRIAGSSTTARLFEVSGESFIATNDANGYFIAGLRTRGYFQGHWHSIYSQFNSPQVKNEFDLNRDSAGAANPSIPSGSNALDSSPGKIRIDSPITDGTNGAPLTRKITHGPGVGGIAYQWFPPV